MNKRAILAVLAVVITAGVCVASLVRSDMGGDGVEYTTEREPTAADYIQDGLIALWDGIENAGWGEHNDLASTWIDLVGGRGITFTQGVNAYFEDNCLWRNRSLGNLATPVPWPQENTTIELICDVEGPFTGTTNPRMMGTVPIASTGSPRLEFDAYEGMTSDGGPLTPRCYWNKDGKSNTKYAIFGREPYGMWCVTARVFQDEVEWIDSLCLKSIAMKVPITDYAEYATKLNVGAWRGTSSAMTGKIFCIRFYNRILTDAEIAHNHIIDNLRFGL